MSSRLLSLSEEGRGLPYMMTRERLSGELAYMYMALLLSRHMQTSMS